MVNDRQHSPHTLAVQERGTVNMQQQRTTPGQRASANRAQAQGLRPVRLAQASRLPRAVLGVVEAEQVSQASSTSSAPFCFGLTAEKGNVRETMEDRVVAYFEEKVGGGYIYAGTYDGHGAEDAAEWLAGVGGLHSKVAQAVAKAPAGSDLQTVLAETFASVDAELLQFLEAKGGEAQACAGATATVALVLKDRIVVANIGDSQAWLCRNQMSVNLTKPHRVYGNGREVDREVKRVKSVGGWVYDGRVCNILAVSRAFGDWEFKGKGLARLLSAGVERGYWSQKFADAQSFSGDPIIVTPDTSSTPLSDKDEFMVVSTDGLWDVVPPQDAMRWARKAFLSGKNPEQVAAYLVETAFKRYTTDNVGCIVVDLKGSEYWTQQAATSSKKGLFGGLFG